MLPWGRPARRRRRQRRVCSWGFSVVICTRGYGVSRNGRRSRVGIRGWARHFCLGFVSYLDCKRGFRLGAIRHDRLTTYLDIDMDEGEAQLSRQPVQQAGSPGVGKRLAVNIKMSRQFECRLPPSQSPCLPRHNGVSERQSVQPELEL